MIKDKKLILKENRIKRSSFNTRPKKNLEDNKQDNKDKKIYTNEPTPYPDDFFKHSENKKKENLINDKKNQQTSLRITRKNNNGNNINNSTNNNNLNNNINNNDNINNNINENKNNNINNNQNNNINNNQNNNINNNVDDNKNKDVNKNEQEKQKETQINPVLKPEVPKAASTFIQNNATLNKRKLEEEKNKTTLSSIYKSIETENKLEMSLIKYPPGFQDEKLYLGNFLTKEKYVNYPLSAIGLLRCDYGNNVYIFGTATLINNNMIVTCAHILNSPIYKTKCNSAKFFLNLYNGKTLGESEVKSFAFPNEYIISYNEEYDYALCVLKQDLGKIGGYLGICTYDEKINKKGYLYGYANQKSTKRFVSSFQSEIEEYEMMGVETSLRYVEDEKNVIYVGNKTKEGQDGSPLFMIKTGMNKGLKKDKKNKDDKDKNNKDEKDKNNKDDKDKNNKDDKDKNNKEKENKEEEEDYQMTQSYDIQIFGIDCSMTSMFLENFDNVIMENRENLNLDQIIYIRNHKGIVFDITKFREIMRWINFFTYIMPGGKIDQHITNAKSGFNDMVDAIQNLLTSDNTADILKKNSALSINCCNLCGKDLVMLFNTKFDISKITQLDLSNNNITHEGIRILSFQEGLCYNVLEVNLSENILNYRAIEYLVQAEFHSLDKLDLSKNYLGNKGVEILSNKGNFPILRELNIAENNITSEGAKYIANGNSLLPIIILHLEYNGIDDVGLYYISMGKLIEMKELYCGGNKIGDEGVVNVHNLKKLELLDLEWNSITKKGVGYLCMKSFKEIKSLNLNNNKIGIEGTFAIASFPNLSIKNLSLSHNDILTKGAELISLINKNTIEYLDISDNFICDLGFYFICQAKFISLKSLNVSLNRISEKGVIYLSEADFAEELEELNISGNLIGDDGVKYISFSRLTNLKTLDISLNGLKSKTGSFLAKSMFSLLARLSIERSKLSSSGLKNLMTSKFILNLIKLDLAYCKLGNEGCEILAGPDVSSIQELNLKDNFINDDGIIYLSKGNFTDLIDLNLEDNDIAKKGVEVIVNVFLQQLKFLRLKGNKRITDNEVLLIKEKSNSKFEKDMGCTFLNYSEVHLGILRYCLRKPDFKKDMEDKYIIGVES